MDSRKIKLIIAAAVGLIALILIAMTIFGGGGNVEVNEEALQEMREDPDAIPGGPRMAPGADPDEGLPPE